MKIYIYNKNFHIKNKQFIEKFINENHEEVFNINDADIIYSPSSYINITEYPKKKFIFGPHFSVFPNNVVRQINNKYNNAIYIHPSQPSVDTWQKEFGFNNIPIKVIPFGVDTDRFNQITKNRENIIVYYKSRDPNECNILLNFLDKKNISYKVFSYKKGYSEKEFLDYLKTCKFGIVLGRHESQGFAIEEMLSCNVPLLVWGATLRKQEYPYIKGYQNVKSRVTTVPYWDDRCGVLFHDERMLSKSYETFINNLDSFTPREFILESVSYKACVRKWNKLLHEVISEDKDGNRSNGASNQRGGD